MPKKSTSKKRSQKKRSSPKNASPKPIEVLLQQGVVAEYQGLLVYPQEKELLLKIEQILRKSLDLAVKARDGVWIERGHITKLFLQSCELSELDFSVISDLQELGLKNCGIVDCPKFIYEQKNLKYLDLSENYIAPLSKQILNLEKLDFLKIDTMIDMDVEIQNTFVDNFRVDPRDGQFINDFKKLIKDPIQFCDTEINYKQKVSFVIKNRHVTQFGIDNQELKSFPESMQHLEGLEFINIYNEPNLRFSPWITKIKSLTKIRFRNSKLTDFPSFIEDIEQLEYLSINNNEITEIPEKIFTRPLKILALGNLKLGGFPKKIKQLTQLEELYFWQSELTTVPPEIRILKKLKRLDMGDNKIHTIPDWIDELDQLEIFEFYNNSLEKLPESIGNLSKLRKLDIKKNKNIKLPDCFDSNKIYDVNLTDCGDVTIPLSLTRSFFKDQTPFDLADMNLIVNFTRKHFKMVNDQKLSSDHCFRLEKGRVVGIRIKSESSISSSLKELVNLTELEELQLPSCSLKSFPSDILKFPKLKHLAFDSNDISSLPKNIKDLKKLEYLGLYYNEFKSFPKEVLTLPNLRSLNLSRNKFNAIPKDIGNLSKLESLDLSQNSFTEIPVTIGNLKSLTELKLNDNPLKAIKDEVGEAFKDQLDKLKIDLSKTEVKFIPDALIPLFYTQSADLPPSEKRVIANMNVAFGTFSEYLDGRLMEENNCYQVKNNHIVGFRLKNQENTNDTPLNYLQDLTYCTELHLEYLRLKELPAFVLQMPWLRILNLKQNDLPNLPSDLQALSKLEKLDLYYNELKVYPEVLNTFKNLKSLDLSRNHIKEIPLSITNLTKIETLDLSRNELQEVPDLDLPKLTQVKLSENKITRIPEEWVHLLSNHRELAPEAQHFITEIELKLGITLPETTSLTKHDSITIRGKQLEAINITGRDLERVPTSIAKLKHLRKVIFESCKLSEIPKELGLSSGIYYLKLSNNHLKELPSSFEYLTNMERLYCEKNDFTEIPWILAKMPNLRKISFAENSGISTREQEILKKDLDEIREYCKQKEPILVQDEFLPEDLI